VCPMVKEKEQEIRLVLQFLDQLELGHLSSLDQYILFHSLLSFATVEVHLLIVPVVSHYLKERTESPMLSLLVALQVEQIGYFGY
jgi:hypothetical protein